MCHVPSSFYDKITPFAESNFELIQFKFDRRLQRAEFTTEKSQLQSDEAPGGMIK